MLSARLLAPEGRGALAAVLFWPHLITALASFSLPAAVISRRARPDAAPARVAATAAWLALALSTLGALGGWLALPFLLRGSAAAPLAQLYLLAFVPFNFLALALLALDQGDMRFFRYNLTRLLPSGVYLVGMLVLWALDAASLAAFVWASWLGTALTALVRLYQNREALCARPALSEARRLLAFGARLHGAALLAVLLAVADRFVVVTFWDDTSLGLYVVALTLATAGLSLVTSAFNILLLPRLAQARDVAAQRRIMGETLRYVSLLLSVGTAVLLVLCPWLLPFLFGDAYAGAIGLCLVLLLAYLPTGAAPGHHPRALRHRRLASAHPGGRPGARDLRRARLAARAPAGPARHPDRPARRRRHLPGVPPRLPAPPPAAVLARVLGPEPRDGQARLGARPRAAEGRLSVCAHA